jgi:hypothetical protein
MADDVVELLSIILDVYSISVCYCLAFSNSVFVITLLKIAMQIILLLMFGRRSPFTLLSSARCFFLKMD